jgi:hypothetical protein
MNTPLPPKKCQGTTHLNGGGEKTDPWDEAGKKKQKVMIINREKETRRKK